MKCCLYSISTLLAMSGLLSACAMAERAMPGTMSDANVIAVMNTIDKSEMEAAELAKQKAHSTEVRNYANHLIADHSASMDKTGNCQSYKSSSGSAGASLHSGFDSSGNNATVAKTFRVRF